METNGTFSVYAFWGGIFSSVLLLVINDFYKSWKRIREKRNEQLEVHREYIRKMLLSVKSLIIRLEHIQKKDKIEVDMSRMRNLLEWYTKDGYYISSTVYLIAHVSCITNNYKKIPLSIDRNVSKISEELQSKLDKYNTIISTDSCLWYHYHVALGNSLNDNNNTLRLSFYIYKIPTSAILSKIKCAFKLYPISLKWIPSERNTGGHCPFAIAVVSSSVGS